MVQKAKTTPTATDRLRDSLRKSRELYAVGRIQRTPVSLATAQIGNLGGSAGGVQAATANYLKTQGDTMIGPIAFFPTTQAIVSEELDIAPPLTGGINRASTYVIASFASPATLSLISGASFSGQLLYLEVPANSTLTIEDFSSNVGGNIITADGNDLVVTTPVTANPQIVTFLFDVTQAPNGNQGGWVVVGNSAATAGGGGTGANQFLSNLLSPTAINQDLLFSATGFDIGDTTNPVEDIFTQRVRLQTGTITVNVPNLTANVGGDMLLNVDTNQNFIFHEAGVQTFSMSDTILSGPTFNPTLSIAINDSATSPGVNGVFTHNSGDVLVFSGGAVRNLSSIGVAGGANTFLSNLTSPTAINQDLLFNATGFDIGNSVSPVEDIFVERVRLQAGTITTNVANITASAAGGNMLLNVDTNQSFIFHEAGVQTYVMTDTLLTGPSFVADLSFALNDSGVDPGVNGVFTRNGADVKVFTGGVLKSLTDIGTGTGGANTALSNLIATSINQNLVSDSNLTRSIGTSTNLWLEGHFGEIQLENSGVNNPVAGANQITGDAGGISIGVDDNNDAIDFFYAGVFHYSFQNDRIQFMETGRQHRIDIEPTFLSVISELTSDSVRLQTGTGRTNENVIVNDATTEFLTQDNQTTFYDVRVVQNNNTPATQREIGRFSGFAENSASTNTDYAHVEISTSNSITSGSEEGRIALVNTVGGTPTFAIRCEGVSGAQRMGFFGVTPVVQQNPAVTAAAIHAALQALGFFV